MLAVVGASGPILFLAAVLVGGAITPGYSHLSNAVSELTQRGAYHALPVQVLFSLSSAAMLAIGVVMYTSPKATWQLRAAGRLLWGYAFIAVLLATVFPMDPIGASATLAGAGHLILVGVSGLFLVVAMFLAGFSLERHFGWERFWLYSMLSILVMASGGVAASLFVASDIPFMGAAERTTQFAYLQWLFVYAVKVAFGSDMRPSAKVGDRPKFSGD